MMVEQQLKLLSKAVARGVIGREAALMLIEQAIPCVMHLENRVGEKLITVLLAMGAKRFQRQRRVKSLSRYAVNIQHTANTRILGSATCPKQWKCPLNDAGDSDNNVSFSNKKCAYLLIIYFALLTIFF